MAIIILSIFIGLITGVVQFFLLYKFVTSVTGGQMGKKTVIFGLTQFLFPFAVLVICAFLLTDNLMWIGIAAAASLIISAVIRFVFASRFDELKKSNELKKSKELKSSKENSKEQKKKKV